MQITFQCWMKTASTFTLISLAFALSSGAAIWPWATNTAATGGWTNLASVPSTVGNAAAGNIIPSSFSQAGSAATWWGGVGSEDISAAASVPTSGMEIWQNQQHPYLIITSRDGDGTGPLCDQGSMTNVLNT